MIKIAAACLALMITPALAQRAPCGPDVEFFAHLKLKYGEVPMMRGTVGDDNSMGHAVLAGNAESGTWSLLAVKDGKACLLMMGKSLTPMEVPEKEPGL